MLFVIKDTKGNEKVVVIKVNFITKIGDNICKSFESK